MPVHVPPMVEAALTVARTIGYDRSCSDCLGMFLQVVSSSVVRGRLLIFGSGTGVATSWIAHAMSPYTKLYVFEADENLRRVNRPVIGEKALVVEEESHDVLKRGPFSFVFVNAARKRISPQAIASEVAPGGIVVVGNFRREETDDELMKEWMEAEGFNGHELLVREGEKALILTRQVL